MLLVKSLYLLSALSLSLIAVILASGLSVKSLLDLKSLGKQVESLLPQGQPEGEEPKYEDVRQSL